MTSPGQVIARSPRWLRLAQWGSAGLNVIFFNGSPDETISGRAYRQGVLQGNARWARARRIIDRLFWFDPDHCRKSHAADRAFARAILAQH